MTTFGRCVAELVVAAGLLVAVQAGAMTTAGSGSNVSTPEAQVTVVNSVITSIDVKQGLLVAAGRTYRFDPANVCVLGRSAAATGRRTLVAEGGQQGDVANGGTGRRGATVADHRARLRSNP